MEESLKAGFRSSIDMVNKYSICTYLIVIFLIISGTSNVFAQKCEEAIIVDRSYSTAKQQTDYEILSASITGDFLKIKVRYHDARRNKLVLRTNGLYEESLPPMINMGITETPHKHYKPKVTTLCYDISQFRLQESKNLVIKLYTYSEKLIYKY